MNNAEQLYYLRPVQWVKVVKSIGTLAIMVFQGKVQRLQRHTISSHLFGQTLLASTWNSDRAVMQLLLHRHLALLLKMLTSTCPANHKEPENIYMPFAHSSVSLLRFNDKVPKRSPGTWSPSRFPSSSQLPGMSTISSASLSVSPLNSFHLWPCLTVEALPLSTSPLHLNFSSLLAFSDNTLFWFPCLSAFSSHANLFSVYPLNDDLLSGSFLSCCLLSCFSCVWLFVTPWTAAHQVPLSMRFSRQEYWSVLPYPPPGDLPNPGVEPLSLTSPALAVKFFFVCLFWDTSVTLLQNHSFGISR